MESEVLAFTEFLPEDISVETDKTKGQVRNECGINLNATTLVFRKRKICLRNSAIPCFLKSCHVNLDEECTCTAVDSYMICPGKSYGSLHYDDYLGHLRLVFKVIANSFLCKEV